MTTTLLKERHRVLMRYKKPNLDQGLSFPKLPYGEAKEFREKHHISLMDMERYTGINGKTILRIEDGYDVTKSISNLYFLAIERLMMLDLGYTLVYQNDETKECVKTF